MLNIIKNFSDNKTIFGEINFIFIIFKKFITIGFEIFINSEIIIFKTENILKNKDININRKKKIFYFILFYFYFKIFSLLIYRFRRNNDKIKYNNFKKNNYISFFFRFLAGFFF